LIEIRGADNLIRNFIQQILPWMARIGYDPNDSDETRLQKTLLVLGPSMFTAAGALWGILYYSLGEYISSSLPLG
jgi:hypothetical protein